MARKKRSGGGGPGAGDWLNTYADMVTLLLTFFILLFSMSSLDAAKFNMLVTAFANDGESSDVIILRGEITGDRQDANQEQVQDIDNLEDVFQFLQELIETEGLSDSLEISQGEGFVFIRFMEDMLFLPNSPELRQDSRQILGLVGDGIKRVQHDAASINIVGHTAAIPDDPDYAVSDRLLSSSRANNVLMFFEDEVKIDGSKLFSTGMGKWKPTEDGDNNTEEGRRKNRRVEILISSENNSLSEQLDNAYENLLK